MGKKRNLRRICAILKWCFHRWLRKLDLPGKIASIQNHKAVDFLLLMLSRYNRHQVAIYAAALAYYTLLSVIPTLLFLISAGSFFLDQETVETFTLSEFASLLPFAADTLRANLEGVIRYRGTLGTISALGTLWLASGLFTVLEKAINAVWDYSGKRKYWERRFMGIITLLILTFWILFTLWARTLAAILPRFPLLESLPQSSLWLGRIFSTITIVLLITLMYHFFPTAPVRWRTSMIGGIIVGLLWQLTREAFAWALAVGLLNYPLVYGSLWGLIVPFIWAYWSYVLFLTGADIQAYIEEQLRLHKLLEDS